MQLLDMVLLFAVDVGLLSLAHRLGIVLTCFFCVVVSKTSYIGGSYGEYSITSVLKLTDIIVYFPRLTTCVILIRSYDVKLSLSHQRDSVAMREKVRSYK